MLELENVRIVLVFLSYLKTKKKETLLIFYRIGAYLLGQEEFYCPVLKNKKLTKASIESSLQQYLPNFYLNNKRREHFSHCLNALVSICGVFV